MLIKKFKILFCISNYHKLYQWLKIMLRSLLKLRKCFSEAKVNVGYQKLEKRPMPVTINLSSLQNTNSEKKQEISNANHNIQILERGFRSASILNQYDSIVLDKICTQFLGYTAQQKIKNAVTAKIAQIVGNQAKAKQCVSSLETVYGILQQSNYILKGDLHSYSLHQLQKYWKKIVEDHNQKSLKYFNQQEMFEQIFEIITTASNFRLPKLGIRDNTLENQKNLFQRQLILEEQCSSSSLRKFLKTNEYLAIIGRGHTTGNMKKQLVEWLPDVVMAVKEKQDFIRISKSNQDQTDPTSIHTTILRLEPVKLATICLVEFVKMVLFAVKKDEDEEKNSNKYSLQKMFFADEIPTHILSVKIGTAIKHEIEYQNSKALFKESKMQNQKDDSNIEGEVQEARKQVTSMTKKQSVKERRPSKQGEEERRKLLLMKLKHRLLDDNRYMNPKQMVSSTASSLILVNNLELGAVFTNILKDTLKIKNKYDVTVPLIEIKHKTSEITDTYGKYFTIHNSLVDKITENVDDISMLHLDKALPMIMKPARWIDYEIGGYYLKPTSMVRIESSAQQEQALKYADLGRTYRILDMLSSTPWRINKRVLGVVEQIWNRGDGASCIPPKKNPTNERLYEHQVYNYYGKDRLKIMKQLQKQKDAHSIRCDFLLKLAVVKSFEDISQFYYPMTLDFRGRVYPVAPHFNHIGADITRGLLKFGEKKKIEKRGFKWLKIHCANLMGLDKKPITDKLVYIDNNIELIRKIAANPYENREWLEHEDCWQLLSTIFQLTEAMSLNNPEEFMSNLHIHQDGSCNGLQHYAALGRDAEGASQVNLDRRELPGDVYTHVGKMVQQKVIADSKDPENPNYLLANILKTEIKRKTIKQTVMTSVYGVTFVGARQQISKQLKDQKIFSDLDEQYKASIYLARYTLECLANLFSGANAIKKWLIECAGIICRTGSTVGWITPFGLPVVQPYRTVNSTDAVKTLSEDVEVNRYFDQFPVNKSRQKSAFPPNFIHSLDSSHMIFTAEECQKRNITFAAVHDSYWTHPSTVDEMNEILRDQFINLHSQPLLENLRLSFQRRFPLQYFPPVPVRGNFNLDKVKESVYFFS